MIGNSDGQFSQLWHCEAGQGSMGVVSGLYALEGESAAPKAGAGSVVRGSAGKDTQAVHIIHLSLVRIFSALAGKVRFACLFFSPHVTGSLASCRVDRCKS